MKKKIIFIASLNTKKDKYDGERIKSTLIFDVLKTKYDVTVINLSINKVFNTIKIAFYALFYKKRFDYLIISKDPHGANIIYKILNFFRYPFKRVIYFEIGPFLYDHINNRIIKFRDFNNESLIVVETDSMKKDLQSLGFTNVDVFPNFKTMYDNKLVLKKYPKRKLRLIYLSRIEQMKGIFDLIYTLKHTSALADKYELDCYGMFNTKDEEKMFFNAIKETPFIRYCGKMSIESEESYVELSKYDLHVFPTKYGEGFPGSIIDFFFAGVPTLSSTFARSKDILTHEDSYFFTQGDCGDLAKQLLVIYENQNELNKKRKASYNRRQDYSILNFDHYLDTILK